MKGREFEIERRHISFRSNGRSFEAMSKTNNWSKHPFSRRSIKKISVAPVATYLKCVA